jgi:hypothetical protein
MPVARMESRMTQHIVTLYTTSHIDASVYQAALRELAEAGLTVELERCPDSFSDWYHCPFLRDEDGENYFGLDGITYFINRHRKTG